MLARGHQCVAIPGKLHSSLHSVSRALSMAFQDFLPSNETLRRLPFCCYHYHHGQALSSEEVSQAPITSVTPVLSGQAAPPRRCSQSPALSLLNPIQHANSSSFPKQVPSLLYYYIYLFIFINSLTGVKLLPWLSPLKPLLFCGERVSHMLQCDRCGGRSSPTSREVPGTK